MEPAKGKNGETGRIFYHTVEMEQPHPVTEPYGISKSERPTGYMAQPYKTVLTASSKTARA